MSVIGGCDDIRRNGRLGAIFTMQGRGASACINSKRYACFLEKIDAWWPAEYRFAPEGVLGIEPLVGGSCFEDVEDGRRLHWGTIQELEEGSKIVLAWQISPKRLLIEDPQKAGIVTIQFSDVEGGAQLKLVHSHFERYGDGWREYLRAMNSSAGWAYCLNKLKTAIVKI